MRNVTPAFYIMDFVGREGRGGCALYIGHDRIVGVDVGRVVYNGAYTTDGTCLRGAVDLTASEPGFLVTGHPLPVGHTIKVTFTLPENFATGENHVIEVAGTQVLVSFQKIDDLPYDTPAPKCRRTLVTRSGSRNQTCPDWLRLPHRVSDTLS